MEDNGDPVFTMVEHSVRDILKLLNDKLLERQLPEIRPAVLDNEEGGVMELPELFLLFRDKDGWYFSRNKTGDPSKQIILAILLSSLLPDLIVGTEYTIDNGVVVWDIPEDNAI